MKTDDQDNRLLALRTWLAETDAAKGYKLETLRAASSDASFRRYFRVESDTAPAKSVIVMDAPPERESTATFERIARIMGAAEVPVPKILAHSPESGFMLITDFGSCTLLSEITAHPERTDAWIRACLALLVNLQARCKLDELPPYDEALLRTEMALFGDWYLDRHLGMPLNEHEQDLLAASIDALVASATHQAVVGVHRDFHSRNLMCTGDLELGVIDFQDAVAGPLTYDVVSLLRDAYIRWPEERTLDWAIRYWEVARQAGIPVPADFGDFYRDYEWMGVQRHLKILGIFARLCHRDGKSAYVDDMPRVLAHLRPVLRRYRELAAIEKILATRLGDETEFAYTF